MNMVSSNVKDELLKLVAELKDASFSYGAQWCGTGTARPQEKRVDELHERIENLVRKL